MPKLRHFERRFLQTLTCLTENLFHNISRLAALSNLPDFDPVSYNHMLQTVPQSR